MAYYPDLGTSTQIVAGPFVRAVGWLAKGHNYPTGSVTQELKARLKVFTNGWSVCVSVLGWPISVGPHECEFCSGVYAAGTFGVPAGALLYVCPQMLEHYVSAHRYRPPDEFIEALLAAPAPESDEYAEAVRRLYSGRLATLV